MRIDQAVADGVDVLSGSFELVFDPTTEAAPIELFQRRVCYRYLRRYDERHLCFLFIPVVSLSVVTKQTTIFPFIRAGFKEPLLHVLVESVLFGSIAASTPKMSEVLPTSLVLVFKDSPWITSMPLPSMTSAAKILSMVLAPTVVIQGATFTTVSDT